MLALMAAKKSAKKTSKKPANKTTKKTTKKAATKTASKAPKKAAKKKAAAKKATGKSTDKDKVIDKGAKKEPAKQKVKSGFSSLAVNMGHVFALRPRVGTSFRPDDFRNARQQLESESFKSAADAARAVVERTIELSRGDANPLRNKHHKRF